MRIAIFHDYIGSIGGGEKLVLTLAKALDADVITTDVDWDAVSKMGFGDLRITTLGKNIMVAPFKQISASVRFARCDFSRSYDFFIFSGNWAHYAARRHKPNMWYCHTPVRAFYDLREDVIRNQKTPLHRLIARAWISIHSRFDQESIKGIDRIITNSENTRSRVRRYHKREATVIYPPVPTKEFRYNKNGDFWLSVNRLYPEKRVPLQIDAFRLLPEEKLKIVGGYSRGDHAEKSLGYIKHLPPNVEVLGSVSEIELRRLYADCRGFIATAIDEDFGMTTVEAMAAGKPVVAVREGGYLETVIDGVTGKFVEPEADDIARGVMEISKEPEKFREACMERARLFDESVFLERMKREIELLGQRS